jgi:ArsR family transcriptional regulator
MRLSVDQATEGLRAAAESTRLRILALLRREELAVLELAQVLGQSQPRVSRHLKVLTEAGLVERFPDGAWAFYRLTAAEPWRDLVEQLLGVIENDGLSAVDLDRLREVFGARENAAAEYSRVRRRGGIRSAPCTCRRLPWRPRSSRRRAPTASGGSSTSGRVRVEC